MTTTNPTLDGLEIPAQNTPIAGYYGEGATESETRLAISEIEADVPLTGLKRTLKQLALSLAKSIDNGNAKGRAVANEAAQLFAMMRELAPPEVTTGAPDDSHLTPETRRLLDALAAPAELSPAAIRDGAGPQSPDTRS